MSKQKRPALGKGLSSLMAIDPIENEELHPTKKDGYIELAIDQVVVNPFQPRVDFDEASIDELAQSIKEQGLLQPIVVRRSGESFQIISGERRYRAMGQLKWTSIPVIIREDVNDRKMLELALVENIQRENLNEIEKADSYARLIEDCGLSHQDLSGKLGKSRSAITNTLRLLKLPLKLQVMVREKQLSMGHARALLGCEDEARMVSIAHVVIKDGLSVREVERLVSIKTAEKPTTQKSLPDFSSFTEQWKSFTGHKIAIKGKANGSGKIEISFKNEDDLLALTERLNIGE